MKHVMEIAPSPTLPRFAREGAYFGSFPCLRGKARMGAKLLKIVTRRQLRLSRISLSLLSLSSLLFFSVFSVFQDLGCSQLPSLRAISGSNAMRTAPQWRPRMYTGMEMSVSSSPVSRR